MQKKISHILIFEPGIRGHHLIWMQNITREFLNAGFKVTIAADYQERSRRIIEQNLSDMIKQVSIISTFDKNGQWYKGSRLKCLSACLYETGAQEVFMNNLDEIMSGCLRLSALGIKLPENLNNRLSGVYFRPRFIENPFWPPGNIIKAFGFKRLCRQSFFKKIFFMDEYLHKIIKNKYPEQSFYFLPDPWQGDFSHDKYEAGKTLGLPEDKTIFLFFGIGDKRKGLSLAVNAMLSFPEESRIFLLCAGQSSHDLNQVKGLEKLKNRGMVQVFDRYVSEHEKELCFCACDFVLLPYINHFGSSGVLSLAAAADKMVIASDFNLLGKRVKEHNLGFVFKNRSIKELEKSINKTIHLNNRELLKYKESISRYAKQCSLKSFGKALILPYKEKI